MPPFLRAARAAVPSATTTAVLAIVGSGSASAHVTVSPLTAPAGAYQVLRFGVGHACDGQPATTALTIELPPGVDIARPQPKPGWTVARRDRTVTWRGRLDSDNFDEFVMLVQLPASGGVLAFPAAQACGEAEIRWDQPTPPGGPRPTHPAPVLRLSPSPSAPAQGAQHQH